MFTTIVILIVLVAFLLILVVLAQNSKGGGLSSQFGGAGTSQIMGVKKTGDLLEKMTWGLAIALIALTLSTKFFINEVSSGEFTSPNIESAQDKAVTPNLGLDTPEGASDENGLLPTEEDSAQ